MIWRTDHAGDDPFEPLRPARGVRVVVAAFIGPVAWFLAWAVAAWLVHRTDAIQLGLLVAAVAFIAAFPVLGLLTWRRNREERRFEEGR